MDDKIAALAESHKNTKKDLEKLELRVQVLEELKSGTEVLKAKVDRIDKNVAHINQQMEEQMKLKDNKTWQVLFFLGTTAIGIIIGYFMK